MSLIYYYHACLFGFGRRTASNNSRLRALSRHHKHYNCHASAEGKHRGDIQCMSEPWRLFKKRSVYCKCILTQSTMDNIDPVLLYQTAENYVCIWGGTKLFLGRYMIDDLYISLKSCDTCQRANDTNFPPYSVLWSLKRGTRYRIAITYFCVCIS